MRAGMTSLCFAREWSTLSLWQQAPKRRRESGLGLIAIACCTNDNGPAHESAPGHCLTVRVRSRDYQQTGTPSGFVAGIPPGRAAVPLKMPQD
jgi:hypothetical protein